jgi:cation-transporting ATPase E
VLIGSEHKEALSALIQVHHLGNYRLLVFGTAQEVRVGEPPAIVPRCLVALDDAVRPESRRTLDLFDEGGIDVRILTGDAPGATIAALHAIGREVTEEQVVRGPELAQMDEDARAETIMHRRVFARLKPEQKREIIKVLQRRKRHVAMVGDGVNDLPAIKEAHVGIAVGRSAEATKEVADIVLEKQTFDVFPSIVEEGRTTIRTVLNVGQLYIGKNLLLLAMSALATLSSIPYPLTPRRGALLSVVGVGIPAVILAASSRINASVKQFIKTMLVFTVYTTVLSVVCAVAAWCTFDVVMGWSAEHVVECMFAGLVGLLLGTFIEADNYAFTVRRTLVVLAVSLGTVIILLAMIPTLPVWINWLRVFYEINPVDFTTGIGMIWSICVGAVMGLVVHRLRRLFS